MPIRLQLRILPALAIALFACATHATPNTSQNLSSGKMGSHPSSNFTKSGTGGASGATYQQGQMKSNRNGEGLKPLIPKHTSSKKR